MPPRRLIILSRNVLSEMVNLNNSIATDVTQAIYDISSATPDQLMSHNFHHVSTLQRSRVIRTNTSRI